jgi:hypothetical protein
MAKEFCKAFFLVVLALVLLCAAGKALADDATHKTVRDGDVVGVQWTAPVDQVTHYTITFHDEASAGERTFTITQWSVVDGTWSTTPTQSFTLPVGTHRVNLYAWRNGNSSDPSDPIWLTVLANSPDKPVGFQFIIRVQ